MLAYKGFEQGLICRGYQFQMGRNVTEQANCKQNGFHCAENPLDCLSYYRDMAQSEYYLVDAGGDVDEDGDDSKISCTELTILKKLDLKTFLLHALAYMVDHSTREWNRHVQLNRGEAGKRFAVVRGSDPVARGKKGAFLAYAKEEPDTGKITRISLLYVDGKKVLPDRWYDMDVKERGAQPS